MMITHVNKLAFTILNLKQISTFILEKEFEKIARINIMSIFISGCLTLQILN